MNKNILITGGSGFIGGHLIEELSKDERIGRIYNYDIASRESSEKIFNISCDIRNSILQNPDNKVDVLFHLAALCKEPGYEWEEYFATNYYGTKNVIEFAEKHDIKNIVFTSTMMVFKAGDKRNSEDDLKAPDTAYGISKLLAEEALIAWANKSPDRRLRIIRPGVVFGKGENGNYTRMFYAIKKNAFAYIGRKTTVKGSVYVKDVIRALRFTADDSKNNIIYNCVIPGELTMEEIVNMFKKVFGLKRFVPVAPYKPAIIASYGFELLGLFGIKTGVHHRRIQKLFYSTNISSDLLVNAGFKFEYPLEKALTDWKNDCFPRNLY